MKVSVVFALLVGSISASPAKLGDFGHHHQHQQHHHEDVAFGASDFNARAFASAPTSYNYPEPEEPLGLYGVPNLEPPKEPSGLYETPLVQEPSDEQVIFQVPITTTTTTQAPRRPDASINNPNVIKPMAMLMPYTFDWGVEDRESGNLFTHVEDSDGANVNGEYRVLLPDNRLQIVRFRSDPVNGYQADVTYELV